MTNSLYDRDRLCGDDVTPQEQELLVRLMEEAGEVVQACAKTLRWGWESVNPTVPVDEQEANGDYLRRELYDLVSLAERLDLVPRAPVSLARAFTEGADWGQFRAIGESADKEDQLEAEEEAQRRYSFGVPAHGAGETK